MASALNAQATDNQGRDEREQAYARFIAQRITINRDGGTIVVERTLNRSVTAASFKTPRHQTPEIAI